MRRSAAGGADAVPCTGGDAFACSGVPHSLQKRPSAGAPHPGQTRAIGVPQEEQNFAPSALDAWHAPQTVTGGLYVSRPLENAASPNPVGWFETKACGGNCIMAGAIAQRLFDLRKGNS